MKKYIINILLVISILFNLAFIGMFLWHRSHTPINMERPGFPRIREKLKEHGQEIEGLRKGFMDERKNFMEFLKGDDFTEAKADTILQIMLDKQIDMDRALGERLIEMKKNGEFRHEKFPEPPQEERNRPNRRRK